MSLDCIKSIGYKGLTILAKVNGAFGGDRAPDVIGGSIEKGYIQNLKKNNGRGKKISPHRKIVTINEGHSGEISTLTR